MKALKSKITKCLPVGAVMTCADNSGAKKIQIISVKGYKGIRRSKPKAGVASIVKCKVIKGNEKVRHEVHNAVIVRQRKEYRRPSGISIAFQDNAAILVDDKNEPRGSLIKGPIAKEVVERFPTIGKIASTVV